MLNHCRGGICALQRSLQHSGCRLWDVLGKEARSGPEPSTLSPEPGPHIVVGPIDLGPHEGGGLGLAHVQAEALAQVGHRFPPSVAGQARLGHESHTGDDPLRDCACLCREQRCLVCLRPHISARLQLSGLDPLLISVAASKMLLEVALGVLSQLCGD